MSWTKKEQKRLGRLIEIMKREGYSDKERRRFLRADALTQNDLAREYRREHMKHSWWFSPEQIDDAVIAFAIDNNRWPMSRDFGRLNGLPSYGLFVHLAGVGREGGGNDWVRRRGRGHTWNLDHVTPRFWMRIAARANELTVDLVMSIPNLTARREAINAIGGPGVIIEKGHAMLWDESEYGKLWRTESALEEREPFGYFVEVVNSTQKVDENGEKVFEGTKPVFDHYFLRVPPTIRTAKDAVAWTGWFNTIRSDPGTLGDFKDFEGFAAQS